MNQILPVAKLTLGWGGLMATNYWLFQRYVFRKPEQERLVFHSAVNINSMIHAVGMILGCGYHLWTGPFWNVENTEGQTLMAQYSFSYFLADSINTVLFDRDSWIYLIHHGLSMGYLGSNLYLGQGGFVTMASGFAGEITNPLQIVWHYSKKNKIRRVERVITPIYTVAFFLVRFFGIPTMTYVINRRLLEGEIVPLFWAKVWLGCSLGLNLAGLYWCYRLIRGYFKYLNRPKLT